MLNGDEVSVDWNSALFSSNPLAWRKKPPVSSILKLVSQHRKLYQDDTMRRLRSNTGLDISKHGFLDGSDKLDKIRYFFTNKTLVHEYVDHFFNTELFLRCSYIDSRRIYGFLDQDCTHQGIMLGKKITSDQYYIIGVILLILRITYMSFFNIQTVQQVIPFVVGSEAYSLALLCLKEVSFPGTEVSEDALRLMLLLKYHQRFSVETPNWMETDLKFPYVDLHQEVLNLGLPLELNLDDTLSNPRRRLWYSMVYAGFEEMIYTGVLPVYSKETYTIKLPIPRDTDEWQNVINRCFEDREDLLELIDPLVEMMTNIRSPATISQYQLYLEAIFSRIREEDRLEAILGLGSETRVDRMKKLSKFIKFLDTQNLLFSICFSIFFAGDKHPYLASHNTDQQHKALQNMIRILNPCIKTFNFFNPQKASQYSLRYHFGYSIELIPLILRLLQRVMIFLTILLSKVRYQLIAKPAEDLRELDRALSFNFRAILSTLSNLKVFNSYASYLTVDYRNISDLIFASTNGGLSDEYKRVLETQGMTVFITGDMCEFILEKMYVLEPVIEQQPPISKMPFRGHINQLLDSEIKVQATPSGVLDNPLETESFLF